MKQALIIWGGWVGHEPETLANRLELELINKNYKVKSTNDFAILLNEDMHVYDVIIPIWSCGIKSDLYLNELLDAIKAGVGLFTFHGGIDWFDQAKYAEMIGATYLYDCQPQAFTVTLNDIKHPITEGLTSFDTISEIYYLQADPMNEVLAHTHILGKEMPIAWTRQYGKGRVFYSTLAHTSDQVFGENNLKMMLNAIDWVAGLE